MTDELIRIQTAKEPRADNAIHACFNIQCPQKLADAKLKNGRCKQCGTRTATFQQETER